MIKGWKKVDESERVGYIHYAWKDGTRINLSLNRGDVTRKWTVTHFPESPKIQYWKKVFNTKSSALRFARNWMKKHPKPIIR